MFSHTLEIHVNVCIAVADQELSLYFSTLDLRTKLTCDFLSGPYASPRIVIQENN